MIPTPADRAQKLGPGAGTYQYYKETQARNINYFNLNTDKNKNNINMSIGSPQKKAQVHAQQPDRDQATPDALTNHVVGNGNRNGAIEVAAKA